MNRYQSLDGQLADRERALQKALADSQNVHDNLDEFMQWLDNTEKDVHKMDKGTVVVAKKAPIQENMQQGAVRDHFI